MSELEPTFVPPGELLADIRALIAEARRQTTVAVNMGLTLLYWRVGQRIHREVLGSERAAYGEQIVVTVSRQLVADYGRGYSEKNLRRMVQFAELFPEEEIVATLSRQLSWSHFSALRFELKPPLIKPTSWDSDEGFGQMLKRIRAALEKAQESIRHDWRKEWKTLSFEVFGTGWHWNKRGRKRPIILWINKREGTNEFEIGYKNRLWHHPQARGKPFTIYSSPANHSKTEMEELTDKLQNKDWQTTELILVEEIRRVAEKVKHVGPDVLTITISPPGVGRAIITDHPQQPRLHIIRSSFVPNLQAEVHLSPWVIGPGIVQPPALLSHSEEMRLGKYLVSVSGPNKPGPMFAGSLKRPSI
jgi:hypothetical protein